MGEGSSIHELFCYKIRDHNGPPTQDSRFWNAFALKFNWKISVNEMSKFNWEVPLGGFKYVAFNTMRIEKRVTIQKFIAIDRKSALIAKPPIFQSKHKSRYTHVTHVTD